MLTKNRLSTFYKNKKILIPGGVGFIGSNLAKRLVICGAKVTVVDSFDKLCGANSFNIKDIKDQIFLIKKKIEDFIVEDDIEGYDIIFNCAGLSNHHIGYSNVRIDYDINCASALALLWKLAFKKMKCRMISIGSRSQYGIPRSKVIDESHPMAPLDIQAIHKVALEQYHNIFATYHGLNLIYVRLTNVYGPCQRLRGEGIGLMGEIIRNAITSKKIIIYGNLSRIKDILFINDVVDALLSLGMADKIRFRTYNLGGGPCMMKELIDAFKANIKVKISVIPFPDRIKKIDTGDIILNTDRLRKVTGWTHHTIVEEGISATLSYYQKYKKFYL